MPDRGLRRGVGDVWVEGEMPEGKYRSHARYGAARSGCWSRSLVGCAVHGVLGPLYSIHYHQYRLSYIQYTTTVQAV